MPSLDYNFFNLPNKTYSSIKDILVFKLRTTSIKTNGKYEL